MGLWKPEERLKYKPSGGVWPSAHEAAGSRLFSPLSHGQLRLSQRTWVPAMVPWRATENGEVTEELIEWYQRFARGKPGAIVVEATGIRDIPSGPLLRIGHDRYMEGLKQIVDAVRAECGNETRLFIQLIDFLTVRRRVSAENFIDRFLEIKPQYAQALGLPGNTLPAEIKNGLKKLEEEELRAILPPRAFEALAFGFRERITDTETPEIANLPETLPGLFAEAAQRAESVGFDGVELHYAHAYTMASFLSSTNTRDDGFGGSLENRVRLPLDVFHEVRNSVSRDFVVGCRFLSDECFQGGSGVDDACFFSVAFAKAGMDYLSISRGGKFDDAKQPKVGWAVYPYTGPSGYECMPQYISDAFGPFGRNLEPVTRMRNAVREAGFETPLVVTGGIHNFEQAEGILEQGRADIVGFARQAMADPDWFMKVRTGAGEQVRLCLYTNYCEGLDQKHKQVTCNLWDRVDTEGGCLKSKDGRRRLTAPEWIPLKTI